MEKRYLLDANIAICFLQGRLTPKSAEFLERVLKSKAHLSLISKIELLSWEDYPGVSRDFINNSLVFPLREEVVKTCMQIRKTSRIKIPDAIIAATSTVNGFELVTRNVSD